MSKGGASAPPSVDPAALAQAQLGANLATANQQAVLNNVNTFSPYGSSHFGQLPSGQFELDQSLNPGIQNAFNQQVGLLGNVAANANAAVPWSTGNINFGTNLAGAANNLSAGLPTGPLDFGRLGLAALPTSTTDFSNQVGQAQKAAYNTQAGFLDPQFAQKRSDLNQQLADQGISAGSTAYDRAQGDLGRQETLAYQQAQDAAVQAGNQEQQALFGENLQSRQQGANEALQSFQSVPNLISSLAGSGAELSSTGVGGLQGLGSLGNFGATGTVPTFGGSPTSVSPANIVGAQQAANTAGFNRFAAGNTLNNQLLNGLGSLGGVLGNSNLLFGSQGLSGLLGLNQSTGLLGSLFGNAGPASSAIDSLIAAVPFA